MNDAIVPLKIKNAVMHKRVQNRTRKWLNIGLYKPPSENENNFLNYLSLVINRLTCQYENLMLIGDFNIIIEKKNPEVFMDSFGLECLFPV